MPRNSFASRHIGISAQELPSMLKKIGVNSLDQLIDETIPSSIRLKSKINLPEALTEYQFLKELRAVSFKNKVFKSYIGLGYYDTIVPGVILRNVLENPGWYTAYTPYQAEISQGRLEALLNYQTMVTDLTGLEITNASLLDEATAAAEAMHMFYASRTREQETQGTKKFFVSDECFPQTVDVLKTRSAPIGIELVIGNWKTVELDNSFFGAIIQYPTMNGEVHDYKAFVDNAHTKGIQVGVGSDLMSLVLLTPPGEWGADVVYGNSQRFGVPLGYGGPHAAFFAARESYKREMPGRIIGVSVDNHGNRALRMALQTREQHIRRDKATSNICTAQVLLAVMAGMYAVYHGPKGTKYISEKIHGQARLAELVLNHLGYAQLNKAYFDTLLVEADNAQQIVDNAAKHQINLRKVDESHLALSIDEATDRHDLKKLFDVFAEATGKKISEEEISVLIDKRKDVIAGSLKRTSEILTHPVFNAHHSETEMLRYIHSLEQKDLSLNFSMIPLGSCTMKLNATSEMIPLSWPEWSSIHPFAPVDQAAGYGQIIRELEQHLEAITGFAGVSLQPNSGAQGEYAGLMVIREYHLSRGDVKRDVVLIPQSAHGTNPASAVMAGMKVVVTKTDELGNIDITDLRQKAELHKERLSCLMVTYPSTHGVFEEGIKEITNIIHQNGGQVYMDGANMNAQVGLTNPANIGADVCHLNLHKTFAIPHGGGGPGMGPIGVAKHLVPFLPSHPFAPPPPKGGITSAQSSAVGNVWLQNPPSGGRGAVSAAPWGSASILLISYAYIKMLGGNGATDATRYAILNANYIKSCVESHYPVLYQGSKGRIAHEMILDCRSFKISAGVEVEDIAKRLMDYGFHAPTMSFPVPGTIMIEPTESESKGELDRFCDALISIREEIAEIEKGADRKDNVLKKAPHTLRELTKDNWDHAYSRSQAAFPLPYLKEKKFWASVGRVDNAYGDRNLVCTCPPIEEYEASEA